MYHRYNADKDFNIISMEDFEAKNEFLRQRDFLERTVKSLQGQVTRNVVAGPGDKMRLIEENTTLIEETNSLRRTLKKEQSKTSKMESVLGFRKKTLLPKEAQKMLAAAIATRDDIHAEYKVQIKVNGRIFIFMGMKQQ